MFTTYLLTYFYTDNVVLTEERRPLSDRSQSQFIKSSSR